MEDCHPLLRGGRRKEKGYSHGLSTAQMHVMATICDTLFPSLPLNKEFSQDEVLSSFYSTSGSQFPFPDEVLSSPHFMHFYMFFLSSKLLHDS
jgi:long-chain-alcohol oxidase